MHEKEEAERSGNIHDETSKVAIVVYSPRLSVR